MNLKQAQVGTAIAGVGVCAGVALGNSATGFIVAALFTLVGGNVVLGLVEGAALSRLLRARPGRMIRMMIVANIASWMGGAFWLGSIHSGVVSSFADPTIASERIAWGVCAVSAWAMTVVIEWPFCLYAARGSGVPIRRSFVVCAIVQTVTTSAVIALLLWWAGLGFVGQFRDARPDEVLDGTPAFTVYAIDPRTGECVGLRWDGDRVSRGVVAAGDASPGSEAQFLSAETVEDGSHHLRWEGAESIFECGPEIPPGYGGMIWHQFYHGPITPTSRVEQRRSFRTWQDLRSGVDHDWFPVESLGTHGIMILNSKNEVQRSIAYSSMYERWRFGDRIVVRDHLMLATVHSYSGERGLSRVVAVDLERRLYAILGYGARAYAELDGVPAIPITPSSDAD